MTDQNSNTGKQSGATQMQFLLLAILFGATIAAQLISLAFGRADAEQSFASMILPSVIFLSVVTLPSIWVGIRLGRPIGLGTPLIEALLSKQPGAYRQLVKDAVLAGILGLLVGGLILLIRVFSEPYLPAELPAFGHRGVIGGLAVSLGAAVAEEVWFRLGLMTLLVWSVARMAGQLEPRPIVVWSIIFVAAVGFGMAHLPQLMSYGAASPFAIGGTIFGNSLVGMLYGWCYWRRGLIAAIVAHFSVDVVLHVLPALAG